MRYGAAHSHILGDGELAALEERFVDAAALAADAGFDFIDIKQCHTYLLNEVLASRNRDGDYGGPYEHRTRFVRNVFAGIRARLGERIALATRINVFDGVPYAKGADGAGTPAPHATPYADGWGVAALDPLSPDLTEPLRLIGDLRALGLTMVNVSMGSPYFNPHISRPFERAPVDGYAPPEHPLAGVERHFALTAQVQRVYPDLPIVGTGYSWLRHFALHAGAANVASGRCVDSWTRPRCARVPRLRRRRARGRRHGARQGVHRRQLLHGADAREAQRSRSICDRLRAAGSTLRPGAERGEPDREMAVTVRGH
jgi:hypothetical protein